MLKLFSNRIFQKFIRNPRRAFGKGSEKIYTQIVAKIGYGYSRMPTNLTFFLTYRCNLRCPVCGQWGKSGYVKRFSQSQLRDEVDIVTLKKVIDDIAQFRPQITLCGGEVMLYATPLRGDMILALLFGIELPFNQIRTQAIHAARVLSMPPGAARESLQVSSARQSMLPLPSHSREAINSDRITGWENEWEVGGPVRPAKPLLEDVPPPVPSFDESNKSNSGNIFQSPLSPSAGANPEPVFHGDKRTPSAEPLRTDVHLQLTSPVVADLNYFCLLIPRMLQHQITGDLAQRIAEWVGQLCMAFGWRLLQLLIQPTNLQWVVKMAPTIPPSHLMDTIRQHTSERIFASFPELKQDNPSGDFWAPGYLVTTGIEPPSEKVIQDFIQQVRNYQGASSPNSF